MTDDDLCPETKIVGRHGPYLCTREVGHAGRHEATAPGGRVITAWTDDPADAAHAEEATR